jgi:cytochrome c nitrite reductase small subunit
MMTRLATTLRYLLGLRFLRPAWQLPAFALAGMVTGAGLFVFHVSRAGSYLSDRPETCVNCHVMTTEYVTWQHSSHAPVATCNDCHVPHESLLRQYAFKAQDGLWHATVFTMRWEPQVIRLSERAVPVVESNCRRCHAQVVEDVGLAAHQSGGLRCWECHREVPHGRVHGLSATPGVFQPQLPSVEEPYQEPLIRGRRPRPDKGPNHE